MYGKYKLLNVNTNAKTRKGDGQHTGYLTGMLYLAPADTSGHNVCQFTTAGCKLSCLNTAGRGGMNSVQSARIRKTQWLFKDRADFLNTLAHDVRKLRRNAAKHGLKPAVRLNGTSDLPWERMAFDMRSYGKLGVWTIGANYPSIIAAFPDVQFYDYTKDAGRMIKFLTHQLPANYDLTFSRSEENNSVLSQILNMGGRVAIVFAKDATVKWGDWPIVNGDDNDLCFLKPSGTILALKAKGRAKRDISGFVVRKVA